MGFKPLDEKKKGFTPLEEAPEDFSVAETVSNVPSSAYNLGKNIYTALRHPLDTASALGTAARGGIDYGARALTEALPEDVVRQGNILNNWLASKGLPLAEYPVEPSQMQFPKARNFEPIVEAYKQRYGSGQAAKQTLMKDPVGVLADVSGVLTAGGSLVPKGGQIAKFGAAIDPLNLVKNTAKLGAKALPKKLPSSLYQSAAKFPTTMLPDERAAITQTALKHGIMPSAKGLDKLNTLIGEFGRKVDNLINSATKSGAKIPVDDLFKHMDDVKSKFGGVRIGATKNVSKINKIIDDYKQQFASQGKKTITPTEAQQIKRDIYDSVKWTQKRGQKASQAGEATYKGIAKGAKESIEDVAPDVRALNQQEGALLSLRDPLERVASRIENRDLIGLGTPMKIGAGELAAPGGGGVLGLLSGITDMPKVKARAALGLFGTQNKSALDLLLENSIRNTLIRQGLLQSGRLEDQ